MNNAPLGLRVLSLPLRKRCEQDQDALVYDLSGGTFDVSIVRIEQGVIEVLAPHGDTHFGGGDLDQLLFNHVCEVFRKKNKINLSEIPTDVVWNPLRNACGSFRRRYFTKYCTISCVEILEYPLVWQDDSS